ncbi:MAG: hypothetical protein NXH95_00005 [Pseudomonadaceae bacterium]|nr:hypothetical protein [Pseudomonadaceae bacterium]
MGLGIFSTGLVLSFPALVFTQMIWGLSWTFSSGADVAWMTNLSTAIVSAGIGMWCLGAAVSMRFPETNFERAQPGELLSVAMHTLKQGLHRVLVHILVCTYLVNGADEAFGRLHANSILLIGGIAMSVMRTVSVVWANKNASNEVRATIQSSPQLWWVAVSS